MGSIVEGESGFGEVVENMEAVITVIPVVRPLYFYNREGGAQKIGLKLNFSNPLVEALSLVLKMMCTNF